MEYLLNKPMVMVDLETLSTLPNAAIISIGAVKFTINGGITDEFTINISPSSSKSLGLHIDKETVSWWSTQPIEARMAWQTNQHSLEPALESFTIWLGECSNTFMVCNGASFDFPILSSSFSAIGKKVPWNFYNELDLRTISTILNVKLTRGNDHNALSDAKNQVEQLIDIFKGE